MTSKKETEIIPIKKMPVSERILLGIIMICSIIGAPYLLYFTYKGFDFLIISRWELRKEIEHKIGLELRHYATSFDVQTILNLQENRILSRVCLRQNNTYKCPYDYQNK